MIIYLLTLSHEIIDVWIMMKKTLSTLGAVAAVGLGLAGVTYSYHSYSEKEEMKNEELRNIVDQANDDVEKAKELAGVVEKVKEDISIHKESVQDSKGTG